LATDGGRSTNYDFPEKLFPAGLQREIYLLPSSYIGGWAGFYRRPAFYGHPANQAVCFLVRLKNRES
jgi:hypothetical protein